ncbi:MAG: HNH endonuclease [Bacteroidales bacterium]|nr:HNH endonuclease [Bacteroidales bacterium]
MSEHIVTESELVLPALWLMTKHEDGRISTTSLIRELTKIIQPTGIDAEILAGRKDTYFSQKVRNLKSHDTFERNGYAKSVFRGFQITQKGKMLVKAKGEAIAHLVSSDYNYIDVLQGSEELLSTTPNRPVIPLDEIVREGRVVLRDQKVYERSQRLRTAAVEAFTHNGKLYCDCCGFEFNNFYGDQYGTSCIEIHHVKPLFMYEDEDMVRTIEQCLPNLLPVCPNCHRVIHRNHISADKLPLLKQAILQIQGRV